MRIILNKQKRVGMRAIRPEPIPLSFFHTWDSNSSQLSMLTSVKKKKDK